MPENPRQVILEAMHSRQQVVATYKGRIRAFCPHSIGLSHEGEPRVFAFQFEGGSGVGWRCLELSSISEASRRDGMWHTSSDYTCPNDCVARPSTSV